MTAVYPSGSNTFVRDFQSSGRLMVGYSRNINKFALNSYVQLRPVTKESGYYLEIAAEEAGRVMNDNGADFIWYDGADAPERNEGTEKFQWLAYKTHRRHFGFRLGDKAIAQADFDVVGVHAAFKAQQAMTLRTQLVNTVLTTGGNWDASHTSAVSSIAGVGGKWDVSTTADQYIRKSINHAVKVIQKDTFSAVSMDEMQLVMGPDTATGIAETQEVVDYIKGSPDALAQIRGEGRNSAYGLPDKLYGVSVVVDDSVKVTSHKNATDARDFIWTEGDAVLMARPGKLTLEAADAPNFSTLTLFMYEEMSVETIQDQNNRVTRGRVVEDYDPVLTGKKAGFYFSSATG